jgi:hypothetical protein
MEFLAKHPDQWVYTSEIAKGMKLPRGSRSAGGMFGAFGRRAAYRYNGRKPWDELWDPTRNEMRYRMRSWISKIINSL